MIVGTAGHIDHGKTALVRALTGVDTDRLPEEKRRGITIELGFAPLVLDGLGTVGLVDVPGHEAFVRTMLAGATGVDVGLLVVAADEGVMPQTREHLAILSLLDVRAGLVALTKCDLVDDEWLALVRDDVRRLLDGTALARAPVVETSAVTGAGIEALRDALREIIEALPRRASDDLFRMPIDRAFTVKGTGTVVTGTVWSGTLDAALALRLHPGDRPVRVRGLQSHGEAVERAGPGTRTAIALGGVELDDASRGGMLVEEAAWKPTLVLRADVGLLPDADRPLRPREWVRLHLGTMEVGARVVAPGGALAPGDRRPARIALSAPLVARAGDRFVLRRASPMSTIGGGQVADPSPPHRRARPWPPGPLSPTDRLRLVLEEAADAGIDASAIPVRVGVRPSDVPGVLEGVGTTLRVGGRVYLGSVIDGAAERVRGSLDEFHVLHPLEEGAGTAWIRSTTGIGETLLGAATDLLLAAGTVDRIGGALRRSGWTVRLSPEEGAWRDRLAARLMASGAEPPSVAELRQEGGGRDPLPLLRILERGGVVIPVEADRYYAAGAVETLVGTLRGKMERGREYTPGELRELLGGSRKYLIPFLEYCDRRRITERRSGGRVLADG
jgi:selenocysteine-specific elongation factor